MADNENWQSSPEALRSFVNSLAPMGGDGQFIFYQALNPSKTTPELADAGFSMIDKSPAAKFLTDKKDEIESILKTNNNPYKLRDLWADTSRNLATEASGDIVVVLPHNAFSSNIGNIFSDTELPRLLSNEKVKTINGFEKSHFSGLTNEETTMILRDHSPKSSLDALLRRVNDRKISGAKFFELTENLLEHNNFNIEDMFRGREFVEIKVGGIPLKYTPKDFEDYFEQIDLLKVSKFAKAGGILGTLYEFVSNTIAAGKLLKEGHQAEAEKLLFGAVGGGIGASGGTALGSVAGAGAVALLSLLTGPVGPVVSFATIGAFALGGGVIGSQYGEELGKALYDFTLNYSGEETLLPTVVGDFFVNWLKDRNIYEDVLVSNAIASVTDANGVTTNSAIQGAVLRLLETEPELGEPNNIQNFLDAVTRQTPLHLREGTPKIGSLSEHLNVLRAVEEAAGNDNLDSVPDEVLEQDYVELTDVVAEPASIDKIHAQPVGSGLEEVTPKLPVDAPEGGLVINGEYVPFSEADFFGLAPPKEGDGIEYLHELMKRALADIMKRAKENKAKARNKPKPGYKPKPSVTGSGFESFFNNTSSPSSYQMALDIAAAADAPLFGHQPTDLHRASPYERALFYEEPEPADEPEDKFPNLEGQLREWFSMYSEERAASLSWGAMLNPVTIVNTTVNERVVEVIEKPAYSAGGASHTQNRAGPARPNLRSMASSVEILP